MAAPLGAKKLLCYLLEFQRENKIWQDHSNTKAFYCCVAKAKIPHPWKGSRPGWMGIWTTCSSEWHPCPWQRGWNWMLFNVPYNPNYFMIKILLLLSKRTPYLPSFSSCNRLVLKSSSFLQLLTYLGLWLGLDPTRTCNQHKHFMPLQKSWFQPTVIMGACLTLLLISDTIAKCIHWSC